jgi:hypothetical protein
MPALLLLLPVLLLLLLRCAAQALCHLATSLQPDSERDV